VAALRGHDYAGKKRAVRVNGCHTPWCYGDVIAVVEGAGDRLDCLIVPKIEGPEEVHFAATLLDQLELGLGLGRRIGLELIVESARGLERVGEIAAASDRVEALIVGPGDLAASLGMPALTVSVSLPEPMLARILVAARANRLQAIDGPWAEVGDLEGLRAAAERAAALGFDGKWAIHPAQVEVLNQVFSPGQAEFDRAWAIVDAHSRAAADGRGAARFGEEMIDEATRRLAAAMVELGKALGLRPTQT
jgi:citrate lyase subunit beta / citryl-CoA lyase